jgi:hypothetical protein
VAEETTTNPRGPTPATNDPRLQEPGYGARLSLVEELGEVADDLRQLAADPDIGLRPYTVHVVRTAWSGGESGRGDPTITLDKPLLPIPEVIMTGVQRESKEGGVLERGDARLEGVSPRYTEDELSSYFDADDGEEAFIEIRIDERDGETKRRRFTLARPPIRRPDRFDWLIILKRADGDRQRSGDPRDDGRTPVGPWPIK